MKKTLMKTLIVTLIALSLIGFVAAEFPFTTSLGVKGAGTSVWTTSNAYTGFYSVEMNSTGTVVGDEGRFVVTLPSGIPLSSLYTISWQVYTILGYPPHVDIFLSSGEALTAEMAVDQGMTILNIASSLPGYWVNTFELFTGDIGHDVIDGSTVFWATKYGAGTSDAPFGTLNQWKSNTGLTNPDISDTVPDVSSDTIVKLEFEVDNWVANSESYIDDILINGLDIMGVTGPKGDTGATGPRGYIGSRGATGPQGLPGLDGLDGIDGLDGVDGLMGLQGPQGVAGDDGEVGEQGPIGLTGPQGETGLQGPQGETGDTGSQGPKGDTGPQGEPAPESVAYSGVALGGISLLGLLYMLFKK